VKYAADPTKPEEAYCTNPFDIFAMEMATRVKDVCGARIIELTIGEAAAVSAL
jgi:electron transfer flavoprotein alpha/beta subunit